MTYDILNVILTWHIDLSLKLFHISQKSVFHTTEQQVVFHTPEKQNQNTDRLTILPKT